jgi:hypothetical protein
MKIRPRNWKSFQHYGDRRPTWIKLHRALLDDFEFHCLPDASRALAPMLWLLASESEDGSIDADPKKLAFRLRTNEKAVNAAIRPLIDGAFFEVVQVASELIAVGERFGVSEKRREEKNGASAPHLIFPLPEDSPPPDLDVMTTPTGCSSSAASRACRASCRRKLDAAPRRAVPPAAIDGLSLPWDGAQRIGALHAGEGVDLVRPSFAGKTALLRQLMLHAITRTNRRVLFISLEEEPDEVWREFTCMAAPPRTPSHQLRWAADAFENKLWVFDSTRSSTRRCSWDRAFRRSRSSASRTSSSTRSCA